MQDCKEMKKAGPLAKEGTKESRYMPEETYLLEIDVKVKQFSF